MHDPTAAIAGGEKETGRVEAFSDGVFAIAITLLVLDIKVPRHETLGGVPLQRALLAQWPVFLAWATSFATILVMWVNHHLMFGRIKRINHPFLFLNGLLLFLVTFIPFPTSLVAEYIDAPHPADARTAGLVFSGSYLLIAVAYNLVWNYAARGGRLIDSRIPEARVRELTREYLMGFPGYGLAFLLAFVSVPASVLVCMLLALYFAFAGSIARLFGA